MAMRPTLVALTDTGNYSLLQIYEQPAIHKQLRPSNILTQVARKKHSRARQILRLPQPSQRDPACHIFLLRFIGEILIVQLCPYRTRKERVTADVVLAQRASGRLHQREHPGFRRRVVCLPGSNDKSRN